MKTLKIFNIELVLEEEIAQFTLRRAIRAVVFDDDNNVAILHISRDNYYSLPGGGVKNAETYEQGLVRECWEETGCKVEIVSEIGQTDEIRKDKKQINRSNGYVVRVVGEKGNLNLEEDEKGEEVELLWVEIKEAVRLVSAHSEKMDIYNRYTRERDELFLKEADKIIR